MRSARVSITGPISSLETWFHRDSATGRRDSDNHQPDDGAGFGSPSGMGSHASHLRRMSLAISGETTGGSRTVKA